MSLISPHRRENAEVASDNKSSDQDGGAGDTENYALAFVSVLIRFYGCPVASKTSSTEYEDAGHFDPKLRGRHRLNKNVDATHFIHVLRAIFFGHSVSSSVSLAYLIWSAAPTFRCFQSLHPTVSVCAQILTLRRLLEAVAEVDRRVEVAIETKHPTRYAGLVERRLVALLDEFGWAGARSPVRVMSFSQLSLRRLRYLAPDLRSVMLFERVPLRFRDGSLPEGVAVAGPSIEIVRSHPRYVERAHRHGHPVHVWTVDAADDIALCRDLGVEAIITNRPGRVLRALGREAGPPPA